jgi:thymidylate synthase (FAD)
MTELARVVAITKPLVEGIDTVDEFIAYVARVSNPSNQMNTETSSKLLKYLIDKKHFSPFEMVNITVEINTTRDIARQILRHRSFSFQEFSQRYADPTSSLGFITREARLQDLKNRQNSIKTDDLDLHLNWRKRQQHVIDFATDQYRWAIENGIAKEQARSVFPEGLTMSRLYMNGSLRSWIHYAQLRTGPETQKEHREVATAVWEDITKHFPSLVGLFDAGA